MGRYLGKRLISTIPLLLVISFVVFMFIHMIPGDPARLVAGQDATKEDVAVVREQLGLDEPLLVQYGKYMKGLFTGDLGSSIKNGKTVTETIAPRLKPTIMLTFSSMIWAAIIGIAIGIIAAVFHGRILDYVGMIIAIAGISVPSFWLGLELIQLFSVSLHGFQPVDWKPGRAIFFHHLQWEQESWPYLPDFPDLPCLKPCVRTMCVPHAPKVFLNHWLLCAMHLRTL